MNRIALPIYVVKKGCITDECEDYPIGTFPSKDEAEKELYKKVVELSVKTQQPVKEGSDELSYYVGDYYLYIDIYSIEVR